MNGFAGGRERALCCRVVERLGACVEGGRPCIDGLGFSFLFFFVKEGRTSGEVALATAYCTHPGVN